VRVLVIVSAIVLVAVVALPTSAHEAMLRRAFGSFMRSAEELRIDAIPDLYDGGYARISAWGKRVHFNQGLRVDEASVRLVGVSLDPDALRSGIIKVRDMRESSFQAKVLLQSVQEYFNASNAIEDLRFSADEGYLVGTGKVMFQGKPTRFRMKGFFAVSGTTRGLLLFRHAARTLAAHSGDPRHRAAGQPGVHQRDWPVTFKIGSVRLTRSR
jgi:hypothetical protein